MLQILWLDSQFKQTTPPPRMKNFVAFVSPSTRGIKFHSMQELFIAFYPMPCSNSLADPTEDLDFVNWRQNCIFK